MKAEFRINNRFFHKDVPYVIIKGIAIWSLRAKRKAIQISDEQELAAMTVYCSTLKPSIPPLKNETLRKVRRSLT